jgi:RNA polymerase sigma-70 factor (ECF subfamily)
MVGSVSEAEDLVQETFLRWQRAVADGVVIESLKAFLSATVTRLAIDQLRSARQRREEYVGTWMPEPLVTDGNDPAQSVEQADSLSMAFLLLLERLTPVERAVFLLHDVFNYDYDEVAGIVGKSEANCRQLALRARKHVEEERPRFEASASARDELAARFFGALGRGDLDGLTQLLARDVVVYGDGGGKAPQWMQPIVGKDRVARLFAGLGKAIQFFRISVHPTCINGQPGAITRDPDGNITNVFALEINDGTVQTIRSIINPEKLRHLGPVADVRALLAKRQQ